MFNLTINSTNVANSLNNMYQYQFKNGAFEGPAGAEMMIKNLILPVGITYPRGITTIALKYRQMRPM
jgi:hypothetical protein